MPGLPLQTDAYVLQRRPPTDSFQGLTVFSAEHGLLQVQQRLPKRSASAGVNHPLDLFDEAALLLESSNQGRSWFVKEARLLARADAIGRNYEALRFASALAALIARHPGAAESRPKVAALLRSAFGAFGAGRRPDLVYFKSLYRFSRDEGYAVREEWLPRLPASDRAVVTELIGRPIADLEVAAAEVARLLRRLEEYLRDFTDILPE